MKKDLIIIGSGIGGSSVLNSLDSKKFKITVIEINNYKNTNTWSLLKYLPNIYKETFKLGIGGTTQLWHNGLIEIPRYIFDKKWPLKYENLLDYYRSAYKFLFYKYEDLEVIKKNIDKLKKKDFGDYNNHLALLIYPRVRINVWKHNKLVKKAKLVKGELTEIILDKHKEKVNFILIKVGSKILKYKAEIFILSTGGLLTAKFLYETKINNKNIGLRYFDHPTAKIAECKINKDFYKIWNIKTKYASCRLPFVFKVNDIEVSFQLMPILYFDKENDVKTEKLLSNLRNNPFNMINYFKVIFKLNYLFEILSFKFGLKMPTNKYSIIMVAEKKYSKSDKLVVNTNKIKINFNINKNDILIYEEALDKFKKLLNPNLLYFKKYNSWEKNIVSSAHHSGSCYIGENPNNSVCDKNLKVHKIKNLYISDASAIPNSGFRNTGLTIAALGLRLGNYLNSIF